MVRAAIFVTRHYTLAWAGGVVILPGEAAVLTE